MGSLDAELQRRLVTIREQGLFRELRRVDSPQGPRLVLDKRELVSFASNDYLGLANHPAVKEAAIRAVRAFGAGAGASRLICGSLAPFHELEEALAQYKGAEAALTFSTGYATALGVITALLDRDDIVIVDRLVHACIVDGARLSGAKLRVYAHNDLNDLEDKLRWAITARTSSLQSRNVLIVTESVFSMDGDCAPLREIVALKEQYGAWLMVDEAHATGLYGRHRRGIAEELGLSDWIEIQMGTLGKALGASGGYICGSRSLVELLVNRARSFIFSTAPPPAVAAAGLAGIRIVQSDEGHSLCERLKTRIQEWHTARRPLEASFRSPIMPMIIGDESSAMTASQELREQGFLVPAIRYPTVARGAARLRITLTAAHTATDVQALTNALNRLHAPHHTALDK